MCYYVDIRYNICNNPTLPLTMTIYWQDHDNSSDVNKMTSFHLLAINIVCYFVMKK